MLQLALSPTSLGDATPPARPAIKIQLCNGPVNLSINSLQSVAAEVMVKCAHSGSIMN